GFTATQLVGDPLHAELTLEPAERLRLGIGGELEADAAIGQREGTGDGRGVDAALEKPRAFVAYLQRDAPSGGGRGRTPNSRTLCPPAQGGVARTFDSRLGQAGSRRFKRRRRRPHPPLGSATSRRPHCAARASAPAGCRPARGRSGPAPAATKPRS